MWIVCAALLATLPMDLTLSTSPRHIYKENDGRDGHGKSESFVFRLIVRGSGTSRPKSAMLELRSKGRAVKSIHFSGEALQTIRETPSKVSADADARYALRFGFDEPVDEKIDTVAVRFDSDAGAASLDVPVADYAQRTKLIFPLRGDFIVVTGHVSAPDGHGERSQQFAYDVMPLGPHLELLRGDGTKNEDFIAFGSAVLAPAAGTVTYARNDVADNPASGNQDMEKLLALPDSPWGIAGNSVVIDHGNGEFSLLAHMKQGSVRVKKGDRVAQGQTIGLLGNSGATTGPHLHYHLMDGPTILRADGLPARFENTCQPMPKPGRYCDTH